MANKILHLYEKNMVWRRVVKQLSHIQIVQGDLIIISRFCIESVCVDAVTGKLGGVDIIGFL